MDMEPEDSIQAPFSTPVPQKLSLWNKLGGGALTIAVIFHVILFIIGAIWIFQIIREPEKTVDFLPGDGERGGGERSAQHQIQQKKRARITPTTSAKRVFAEGATSNFAIPEQGDSFGQMSALSSLAGGGSMGGGLDFNGIHFTQAALMCKEVSEADTIYWFADFQDKVDEDEMRDVLRKLKSRKQKLIMHAPVKGRNFDMLEKGLAKRSGGQAILKELKK